MEDLEPCPFCGEKDISYHPGDEDCFYQCNTCTTTGPNGADHESATLQWNRRYYDSIRIGNDLLEAEIKLPWNQDEKK